MNDQAVIDNDKLAGNELVEKLNFYNNLLNQAEKIAKLGHWQWNIKTNKIIWSNNLFCIYGIEKDDQEINFETL
ncbi:MAG TPA: hypothetical protein VGO09_09045 [Flavisolibacter sp.]|nr:hypothetical protein [Flavisolibacter sp.]